MVTDSKGGMSALACRVGTLADACIRGKTAWVEMSDERSLTGTQSLRTPDELRDVANRGSLDGDALVRTSA